MTTAKELLTVIDTVDTQDKSLLALAIKRLKGKMVEDVLHEQDPVQVQEYAHSLTKEALETSSIIGYTAQSLSDTSKSTLHKEVIREVVSQFEQAVDVYNPALRLAWNKVKKSTNLRELRSNLEMYITIRSSIEQSNMEEYVQMIDEQDVLISVLKEQQRINEELFRIVKEDDTELKLYSDIENAKIDHTLTDSQACNLFSIDRYKLNYLRKKFGKLEISKLNTDQIQSLRATATTDIGTVAFHSKQMKAVESFQFDENLDDILPL